MNQFYITFRIEGWRAIHLLVFHSRTKLADRDKQIIYFGQHPLYDKWSIDILQSLNEWTRRTPKTSDLIVARQIYRHVCTPQPITLHHMMLPNGCPSAKFRLAKQMLVDDILLVDDEDVKKLPAPIHNTTKVNNGCAKVTDDLNFQKSKCMTFKSINKHNQKVHNEYMLQQSRSRSCKETITTC